MKIRKLIVLIFLSLAFILLACGAQPTQVQPTAEPGTIPQSEAAVPRVSIEEAKAAFESGAAIIVDVRGPEAYETSHVAGAISVPLGEIEQNIDGLTLEKDQWIITYCT